MRKIGKIGYVHILKTLVRWIYQMEMNMLNLSDINRATNSYDGDVYSDLYKAVYGSRPRYAQFESVEDFDRDFNRLSKMLSEQEAEKDVRQAANLEKFSQRVLDTMALCNCDKRRAVEIIAEAEDEADAYQWYGPERLEWIFDLKYGSIKQAIFGEF